MLIRGFRILNSIKYYPIKTISCDRFCNFEVEFEGRGYLYAKYNKDTDKFDCINFAFKKGEAYNALNEDEVDSWLSSFYPTKPNKAVTKLICLLVCFYGDSDFYDIHTKGDGSYFKGYVTVPPMMFNGMFTASADGVVMSFRKDGKEVFRSSSFSDIDRYCEVISSL